MWPFRRDRREPPEEPKRDDWTIGQGQRDGFPMIVRIANAFAGLAPVAGYGHHIIVSVRFRNRMPNGFPSSEESDDLGSLEEKLCGVLEAADESRCVLVVTNNGLRDFIFYTKDAAGAKRKLDENVRVLKGFEVELAIEPDSEWQIYRAFARMLTQRT